MKEDEYAEHRCGVCGCFIGSVDTSTESGYAFEMVCNNRRCKSNQPTDDKRTAITDSTVPVDCPRCKAQNLMPTQWYFVNGETYCPHCIREVEGHEVLFPGLENHDKADA